MYRKRPFATRRQEHLPARAAVCRIPCLILCLADVERVYPCRAPNAPGGVHGRMASVPASRFSSSRPPARSIARPDSSYTRASPVGPSWPTRRAGHRYHSDAGHRLPACSTASRTASTEFCSLIRHSPEKQPGRLHGKSSLQSLAFRSRSAQHRRPGRGAARLLRSGR